MASLGVVILLFACISLCSSTPETTEHGAGKTSHFKDGAHNPVFDQEALLGSHKVDELNELPPEVRLKRLRNLAKSHDSNNNDIIETDELKAWVLESFRMLDREEAMERFEEEDENEDGKVTFGEILHKQYGYSEDDLENIMKEEEDAEDADVYQLITEDKTRFEAADLDKNGNLDEKEYVAFVHPYDFPHMHETEMAKAVKPLGYVTMEDFIGDVTDEESRLSKMTNFEELDLDKDGKLTPEELRPWVLPDNDEIATEEVEHLVNMCDEDKDGHLSIDEIVAKEEEFLSSSATDYGRTLHFVKDEL